MPKIKEIGNVELKKYLNAYEYKSETFPDNEDFSFRVVAIGKVLKDRDLLGINIKSNNGESLINSILKKLKIRK